ncbi:MAG: Nif3-like dinuclear metal center hexameric protein [Clostridia bacterium]|nr:Nif3-like dinuclear metal center hexameric protein [Clostridia bacterium]
MTAQEIISHLFSEVPNGKLIGNWDICAAGNPETEVTKVAVAMFGTIDLIKQVKIWGAQLLIVHEPLFYDNPDNAPSGELAIAKKKIMDDSGMVIYRYHDHPHSVTPDLIGAGMFKYLGLEGEYEYPDVIDLIRLKLTTPMTPRKVGKMIEERLHIKHVRICGALDAPCTKTSEMFGTPGGVNTELFSENCEILLTGEIGGEWYLPEYVRDAAALGQKKAIIVMGHIGSEHDCMRYITDLAQKKFPQIDIEYFECGEVYGYTEK